MIVETRLNDGTPVCIRRVRKDDEDRLKAGIASLSNRSRYLRFFSGMKEPPQVVIDRLLEVDGHDHIAWGAIRNDIPEAPALGIVHAFRELDDPDSAEFSVAVIDGYHGRGLARLLTAVLLLDCRDEGLEELAVHILAENDAALALTRSMGGQLEGQERGVYSFAIEIEQALEALRAEPDTPGLKDVFAQFGA
jgi:ribosomal protein S18 acetylase RimI-like enzyme